MPDPIERLPLAERADAYGRRLEQLRRALDDPDEPLDFDVDPAPDDAGGDSDRTGDAGRAPDDADPGSDRTADAGAASDDGPGDADAPARPER